MVSELKLRINFGNILQQNELRYSKSVLNDGVLRKILLSRKKIVKNALLPERFSTYQKNPTHFCRWFSLKDTVEISSRSDKNCLSSTASRVEKCSLEKNAFKSSKSGNLLCEAFEMESCDFENKTFLGIRPFAIYFLIPKGHFKQKKWFFLNST